LPPPPPSPTELLEREGALEQAASALARAARAEPSVLFVVGEPGLGKTTVLDWCCARGHETGFDVRRAYCSELEQSVPFGMLDRLFEGRQTRPAESGPASPGTAASEARLLRYTDLLAWLRGRSPKPLLLAVDDLHWADVDSIELLSLLCRRLDGVKVSVLATCRPWPGAALDHARALAHDRFASTYRLRPLSEAASATLLEQRLGRPPERLARDAHEACAGNPLLLAELAGSLQRGEPSAAIGGKFGERVFLPRFAGVGALGMRWARAASVLGSRFRLQLATQLSGLTPAEAVEAVEALTTSGLVREAPDATAEFVHPLVRKAIYEDLSPLARREQHSRALGLLLDGGAPASEAAPHAVGGDLQGEPRAIAVLVDAGREALAAGAVATAAEHFQAATHLAGAMADPSLRIELAEACLLTGKLQLAAETLHELLQQAELATRERVVGMRLEAHLLMVTARYEEAKARWQQASQLAVGTDTALAAEILLDGAYLGFLFEGQREAMATVRNALEVCRSAADCRRTLHPSAPEPPPPRRFRVVGNGEESVTERTGTSALIRSVKPGLVENNHVEEAAFHAQAYLACLGGDPKALDDLMEAARSSLRQPCRRSALGWDVAVAYANLARVSERFDDALAMFSSLSEEALSQGSALTFWSLAVNRADLLWRLGRLAEAAALLAGAADATAVAPSRAAFAWIGMAHVSQEQGDDTKSAAWAGKVEEVLPRTDSPYLRMWLALLSCRRLLRAGEPALAARVAEKAQATADSSGILEPCVVPWHGAAIEALVSAGQLEKAEALVDRLAEICRPLSCRAPRAVAAWGHALVSWQRGRLGEARTNFEQALAHNAAVPMPLAEAETLVHYARFLRRTGEVAGSREALHRALSVLEGTDAGRLQNIAREELSGAGGRRRRPRSDKLLTPREEMVAGLAARGLTNAQIARTLYVSPKTVDHHLSSTYAKLGLSSRRQLMLCWPPARGPAAPAR